MNNDHKSDESDDKAEREPDLERELAAAVRELVAACGCTLREVEERAGIKRATLSANQTVGTNSRVITKETLEKLIRFSPAGRALKDRARCLWEQIHKPATANGAPPEPPPSIVINNVVHAATGRPTKITIAVSGTAVIAVAALAYGILGARPAPPPPAPTPAAHAATPTHPAPTATRTPRPRPRPRHHLMAVGAPTPHPTQRRSSPKPCTPHRRYRVDQDGNLLDAAKTRIGAVTAGDTFVRDDSPAHPAMAYHYYGTVTGQGRGGYVLQQKLAYVGTVCAGGGVSP